MQKADKLAELVPAPSLESTKGTFRALLTTSLVSSLIIMLGSNIVAAALPAIGRSLSPI
jgi:hypothetical protein